VLPSQNKLIISPTLPWGCCCKSGEFRERLTLSQLEAKHVFIFLAYLRVIFFLLGVGKWCIRVYFITKSSYFKHVRSTTSRWVYKKYNNSTTSARSLALFLILLSKLLFLNKTLQLFMAWLCFLLFFYIAGITPDCEYIYSSSVCMSFQIRTKLDIRKYYSTLVTQNDITEDLQALHSIYIRELYKDREAPVIPFDRDLILATCHHCLDKNKKSEFLKEWGYKGCIYIIEYKYNPFIYYIGRTTMFKRRFSNHLLADSNSKLHVFLKLVGWEHFNISILEVCSSEEQGARENYYLQKYLPLLNTTFSSKFTESAIYSSLSSKLAALKSTPDSYISGQPIPVYMYEVYETYIDKICVKYSSITEASRSEKIARGTLGMFRDTNVPFRNKLYYSKPIINFELTFNLFKTASSGLNLNSNIAKQVWVYNAKTLELIKGSPFPSKTQASVSVGISRNVITYFIDTWKAEGVKGTYLFSRPLEAKEVENLIESSHTLELGNKIKVWAYNAKTLELVNNSPFSSLLSAANHFKVNYRTITRHLDTKLAGSSLGFKHSEETLKKMKERKHSEETRAKLSEARKGKPLSNKALAKLIGRTLSEKTKAKMKTSALSRINTNRGQPVKVFDKETNKIYTFSKMSELSKMFGVSIQYFSKRLGKGTNSFLYKTRYLIEKIKKKKWFINNFFIFLGMGLTKREAIRALKIHITVLNKYLDSSEIYKGFLIFSSPQNSEDKLE